jgi:ABC-type antimicrobial peptide transport system permease subunit
MSVQKEVPILVAESIQQTDSPIKIKLRRLFKHRSAQLGMFLLGILILCAVFAEQIAPYDPIVPLRSSLHSHFWLSG